MAKQAIIFGLKARYNRLKAKVEMLNVKYVILSNDVSSTNI
jgi:hypothetical protein